MKQIFTALAFGVAFSIYTPALSAQDLGKRVDEVYQHHLADLFVHFHQNPELSFMETQTAARLANELESVGFTVYRGIAQTGLVALMENGSGPMVMVRADMDGLPVEEKSGLSYASRARQTDWNGNEVYVMHACGHDVHITSLVGTAKLMSEMKSEWQGTLMLIGQPAEERVAGAKVMRQEGIWDKFGRPDYALALHVAAVVPTGKIAADPISPYSGADTVDILIKGIGAHGASPHTGVDPIVLGSQIVMGLQTVVSRTLPPRRPGVITVGAFHSGTKHNIISDSAELQLTVRSESEVDRQLLLSGIKRIAENMGRVAGLPEDMLPVVIVRDAERVPPTLNNPELASRLRRLWSEHFGANVLYDEPRLGMGAEDFPFFTTDPYIPSLYFAVGGTPQARIDAAKNGGPAVASHHSPLFKIEPEGAVTLGVEATVTALLSMMSNDGK